MQIFDFKQRSHHWYEVRMGVITASNFKRLITPTGKPSSSASAYINELIIEQKFRNEEIIKKKEDGFISEAMQHGIDTEPQAREEYIWMQTKRNIFVQVHQVGFIRNEEKTVGCSPDGLVEGTKTIRDVDGSPLLVEPDGQRYQTYSHGLGSPAPWMRGLEIKCPQKETQAGYFRNAEQLVKNYYPQVQGCMWVTGALSWDLFSFHPQMKHVLVNVPRDEDYINKLQIEVAKAVDEINTTVEKLNE
mgnify:CR=1 FL=1|jgi:hypothetical protein